MAQRDLDYDQEFNPNYASQVRLLARACTELREIHKHLEIMVEKLTELVDKQPGKP